MVTTTSTVGPGLDYETLDDWQNARSKVGTTGDVEIAQLSAGLYDDEITLTGWNAGIQIRIFGSNVLGGDPLGGTTFFRTSSTQPAQIQVEVPNTVLIRDISFAQPPNTSDEAIRIGGAGVSSTTVTVNRCVFADHSTSQQDHIYIAQPASGETHTCALTIRNSIFFNAARANVHVQNFTSSHVVNVTMIVQGCLFSNTLGSPIQIAHQDASSQTLLFFVGSINLVGGVVSRVDANGTYAGAMDFGYVTDTAANIAAQFAGGVTNSQTDLGVSFASGTLVPGTMQFTSATDYSLVDSPDNVLIGKITTATPLGGIYPTTDWENDTRVLPYDIGPDHTPAAAVTVTPDPAESVSETSVTAVLGPVTVTPAPAASVSETAGSFVELNPVIYIGDLNIAQLTPHDRTQVFTPMISVPDGLITDASQPLVRVRDTVTGDMVQAHYVNGSMKRKNGSWRHIRAQFPASLLGASGGQFGYSEWSEKQLVVETGMADTPIPAYSIHPAVNPNGIRCQFRTQMRGAWSPDISSVVYASGPERTWQLRSDQTELYDPFTQDFPSTIEAPEELEDTVGAGNRWMRAYRTRRRLLPEAEDFKLGNRDGVPDPVNEEEPSLAATLLYEVPSVEAGPWARCIRFWVEITNSMVTDDDNVRAPQVVCGLWDGQQPRVNIFTSDGTNFPAEVFLFGEDAVAPNKSTFATGIGFGLTNTSAGSNYDAFHNGMSRVYQGVMFFKGGDPLTADEQALLDALRYQPSGGSVGEDCVLYAMQSNLKDHDTFGVFGVVPDIAEHEWASMADFRTEMGAWCRGKRDNYRAAPGAQPDFWQVSQHGLLPATNATGSQSSFGAYTGFHWAMSGHPDVRSLMISAYQETARYYHYRRIDCTPYRYDDVRIAGTPATWQSSTHFNRGVKFYIFSWNHTYPSKGPDRPWQWYMGKWGTPPNGGDLSTPRPGGAPQGWVPCDYEHFVYNLTSATMQLTGDRWLLEQERHDLVNVAMCSRQGPESLTNGAPYVWSQLGTGQPRSEGRFLRSVAQIAQLVTDPDVQEDFFEKMRIRADALLFWSTRDNEGLGEFGDLRNCLFSDQVTIAATPSARYFSTGSFRDCDNPALPAFPDGNGDAAGATWQNGLECMGIFGLRQLVDKFDTNNIRRVAVVGNADVMLFQFSKGWALWGYELQGPDDWIGFFAIRRDIDPMVEGKGVPASSYGLRPAFCNSDGSPAEVGKWGGALIPHNGGVPEFEVGRKVWGYWGCAPILLANTYHPDDVEVQVALDTKLRAAPGIWETPAERRTAFFGSSDPAIPFAAIVANPFAPPVDVGNPPIRPEPAESVSETAIGAVVLGAVTVSPAPAVSESDSSVEQGILGDLVVSVGGVEALAETAGTFTTQPASLVVSPAPAESEARAEVGEVVLGAISVAPEGAESIAETFGPLVAFPLTLTPAPATSVSATALGAALLGPLRLFPDSAESIGASELGAAILGPLTLVPAPAESVSQTRLDPGEFPIRVQPAAAISIAETAGGFLEPGPDAPDPVLSGDGTTPNDVVSTLDPRAIVFLGLSRFIQRLTPAQRRWLERWRDSFR